jgi:hypothetical protein
VVVDPRGWVPPVAADQIDQTALAAFVRLLLRRRPGGPHRPCHSLVAVASARFRETSSHGQDR